MTVIILCQVIRRIENHEISECEWKKTANVVKILMNDPPDDLFGASGCSETQQIRRERRPLGVAASERSVAWRSFLHGTS